MTKTYSLEHVFNLAPSAALIYLPEIVNTNREFKVRSVYFGLSITELFVGKLLNLSQQTTQAYVLTLMEVAPKRISDTFKVNPRPFQFDGNGFSMYEPGQLFFTQWTMINHLQLDFHITNLDAAITYNYHLSLVVETEILKWTI